MSGDDMSRLVPLEGGVNFRDMGGYETLDGRRVKWRHLYRSGTMHRLSDTDRAHLDSLGIRTVIDFRTLGEQTEEPNAWGMTLGEGYWSRPHSEKVGDWSSLDPTTLKTARDGEMIMEQGYRRLPEQQAEAYARMLARLAQGHVPAVIHCTAGKDRTGGGAAVILALLGVPRDSILADFQMTERTLDLALLRRRQPTARLARYTELDPEVVKGFSAARPSFIAAFLDSIDERHGGMEHYASALGLAPSDIEAIRAYLLE